MTTAVEIHLKQLQIKPPPPPPSPQKKKRKKERKKFSASASTGFKLMASYFRARYHTSALLKLISV